MTNSIFLDPQDHDYVGPIARQAAKTALSLNPATVAIQRMTETVQKAAANPVGRSAKSEKALKAARDAIATATEAVSAARNSGARLYATSVEAKDEALEAVRAADEIVARQVGIVADEESAQLDGILDGLEAQRAEAAEALKVAADKLGALVESSQQADRMARARGDYAVNWHESTTGYTGRVGAKVADVRAALKAVESDDAVANGTFPAYRGDDLPSWTREAMGSRMIDTLALKKIDEGDALAMGCIARKDLAPLLV